MQIYITLLVSFVLAQVCRHFAKKRGRNPTHWFIGGFFFGIFAVVLLFLLPVRRVKTDAPQQPLEPQSLLTILQPDHVGKLWYFIDEEKQQLGPMSFDALGKAWQEGKVREQTYVWNEAMENWQTFQDVIKSTS